MMVMMAMTVIMVNDGDGGDGGADDDDDDDGDDDGAGVGGGDDDDGDAYDADDAGGGDDGDGAWCNKLTIACPTKLVLAGSIGLVPMVGSCVYTVSRLLSPLVRRLLIYLATLSRGTGT